MRFNFGAWTTVRARASWVS